MGREIRSDRDFRNNQLKKVRIENLPGPPNDPVEGKIYWDTRNTDNRGLWGRFLDQWRQFIHTHWNGNVSGLWNFVRNGTPFQVLSDTLVANLNSDKVDGHDASEEANPGEIPVIDAQGHMRLHVEPTLANHAVNKEYADSLARSGGTDRKDTVRVATARPTASIFINLGGLGQSFDATRSSDAQSITLGTVTGGNTTNGVRNAGRDFNTLQANDNDRPAGIWSDGTTMWVTQSEGISTNERIYAYDFATMATDSAKDISINRINDTINSPQGIWRGSDGVMWVIQAGSSIREVGLGGSDRHISVFGSSNNNPQGLWGDDITLWVSDSASRRLFAYNLETLERDTDKDIAVSEMTSPQGIWSDGATMWVADSQEDKIFAYNFDGTRDAARDFDTLAAAGNENPHGIWSDGTNMYVLDSADDQIYAYRFGLPTNAAIASRVAVDGISLSEGDRILVLHEGASGTIDSNSGSMNPGNGIYRITVEHSGTDSTLKLVRTDDFNDSADLVHGAQVFVAEGTTQSGTTWVSVHQDSWTPGTDNVHFTKIGGEAIFRGEQAIQVDGPTIRILLDTNVFQQVNGRLELNPTWDPGTTQSGLARYTTLVGNDSADTFTIPHNLNSRLITVTCIEESTGEVNDIDWKVIDVNNIEVDFGADIPTNNQFRLIILG